MTMKVDTKCNTHVCAGEAEAALFTLADIRFELKAQQEELDVLGARLVHKRPYVAAALNMGYCERELHLDVSRLRYECAGLHEKATRALFRLDTVVSNGNQTVRTNRKELSIAFNTLADDAENLAEDVSALVAVIEPIRKSFQSPSKPSSPLNNSHEDICDLKTADSSNLEQEVGNLSENEPGTHSGQETADSSDCEHELINFSEYEFGTHSGQEEQSCSMPEDVDSNNADLDANGAGPPSPRREEIDSTCCRVRRVPEPSLAYDSEVAHSSLHHTTTPATRTDNQHPSSSGPLVVKALAAGHSGYSAKFSAPISVDFRQLRCSRIPSASSRPAMVRVSFPPHTQHTTALICFPAAADVDRARIHIRGRTLYISAPHRTFAPTSRFFNSVGGFAHGPSMERTH